MKTIIDPSEARRFARFLDDRAKALMQANRAASLKLLETGRNGWRDVRYEEFLRRFAEASQLLQEFLEHSEKYATYLRRKATAIEAYLGGRRY